MPYAKTSPFTIMRIVVIGGRSDILRNNIKQRCDWYKMHPSIVLCYQVVILSGHEPDLNIIVTKS